MEENDSYAEPADPRVFRYDIVCDLPPKSVPLIEGKSLAKIKQIMQEIMYEKETIYRRADPRDT